MGARSSYRVCSSRACRCSHTARLWAPEAAPSHNLLACLQRTPKAGPAPGMLFTRRALFACMYSLAVMLLAADAGEKQLRWGLLPVYQTRRLFAGNNAEKNIEAGRGRLYPVKRMSSACPGLGQAGCLPRTRCSRWFHQDAFPKRGRVRHACTCAGAVRVCLA